MKKDYIPVYNKTYGYANANGETNTYFASCRENTKCANAISETIRRNFDGLHLADCAGPVIDEFGLERVKFVLANTVQQTSWDGRWSKDNVAWAESFDIVKSEVCYDWRVSAHPAVLNGFINDIRKIG